MELFSIKIRCTFQLVSTVLAFRKPWNGDRCVYLDSDAYWFPDRPDQLTLLSKKGAE